MPRPPARLKLRAGPADAGPLVRFVVARGGVTEELALSAITRGGAYIGGKRVRDPQAQVAPGDDVAVLLHAEAQPLVGPERILMQDEWMLAVDKPAGVTAQEDRAGGQSLPDLIFQLTGFPALLVHRLDRGTTGVTVLAKTKYVQGQLLEEFREHRVRKEYRALVSGEPPADTFEVDLALGPAPDGSRQADPRGEAARTRFRVLERLGGAALVAAFPETGRTHQIRVHLRAAGFPILGDGRYGGPLQLTRASGLRLDFQRPLLHASLLSIAHPRGRGHMTAEAPLPEDFRAAADALRSSR